MLATRGTSPASSRSRDLCLTFAEQSYTFNRFSLHRYRESRSIPTQRMSGLKLKSVVRSPLERVPIGAINYRTLQKHSRHTRALFLSLSLIFFPLSCFLATLEKYIGRNRTSILVIFSPPVSKVIRLFNRGLERFSFALYHSVRIR